MLKKILPAITIALLFGMLGMIGYFLPRVRKLEEFIDKKLKEDDNYDRIYDEFPDLNDNLD